MDRAASDLELVQHTTTALPTTNNPSHHEQQRVLLKQKFQTKTDEQRRKAILQSGKRKVFAGLHRQIVKHRAELLIHDLAKSNNISGATHPRKKLTPCQTRIKSWLAPCGCAAHAITLWLVWTITLNCIWTFDSFDAVELIERQVLQSESSYNHEVSSYKEVDSLTSLDEWITNTVNVLFREVNDRPLLRYGTYKNKDKACVPRFNNNSYPLLPNQEKGSDEHRSYNYRTLRPLVDIIRNRNNRQQSGATYLADGLLIRQVRGTMVAGQIVEIVSPPGPATFCNRSYATNSDLATSVISGLYVDYPTSRGYDLYLPADITLADATQQVKDALDCGWLDEYTRALVITTTFSTFGTLPLAKDHHVINTDNIDEAFGGYVDVSLSMLFEIPQSGIVRGWHEFQITDRTNKAYGTTTELLYVSALTVLMCGRVVLYCLKYQIGTSKKQTREQQNNTQGKMNGRLMRSKRVFVMGSEDGCPDIFGCLIVVFCLMCIFAANKCEAVLLKSMPIVIWAFAYVYYLQSGPWFLAEKDYTTMNDNELSLYCSSQFYTEINSGAGRMGYRKLFLTLFGLFSLLQCWETLNYLTIFPKVMVPVRTITSATREVGIFLIVYIILIFGLTICLHIMFGEVGSFSTVGNTLSTVLLVTLDQLSYSDIFEGTQYQDRLKAHVALIALRITLQVIFLNNIVAIVLAQYEIARSEKRIVSELSHKKFLKCGVKSTQQISKCRTWCCNTWCNQQITNIETERYLTRSFRKWYHTVRNSVVTTMEPVKYDTEVIIKELRKVMQLVREVDVEQHASQKEMKKILVFTEALEYKLSKMNLHIDLKFVEMEEKMLANGGERRREKEKEKDVVEASEYTQKLRELLHQSESGSGDVNVKDMLASLKRDSQNGRTSQLRRRSEESPLSSVLTRAKRSSKT